MQRNQIRILLERRRERSRGRGPCRRQTLPPEVPAGCRPAAGAAAGRAGSRSGGPRGQCSVDRGGGGVSEDRPDRGCSAGPAARWSNYRRPDDAVGLAASAAGPIWEAAGSRAETPGGGLLGGDRIGYEQTGAKRISRRFQRASSRARNWKAVRARQRKPSRPIKMPWKFRSSGTLRVSRVTSKCWRRSRNWFRRKDALALTELNRRLVIVQLTKALGGGWKLNGCGVDRAGAGTTPKP